MLQLRTLGAVDLRTDAGEARAVLRQPKRLALLVFLALAAPRRYFRRDTLLAHFWPELDQDHARAALRRALYFLRRAVGESVLAGRGEEEIGVAEGALWCDVVAFEAALEAGELREALALYRGDFLAGFYVAGAPEVERWMDAERGRLRERAAQAAWMLAEAPGAAPADVVPWANLAAALTPDDEGALRRQLGVLERAGERGAALRAYDSFARRLASDGLEPEAATAALAARIRARPAPGGVAQPAAEAGPMLVAVLPFTVRGSAALAYLGEGMVDLLCTALDGVGELRAVDPGALLTTYHAQRDAATEREITTAEHLAATHLVRGSVFEAGGRVRIVASLEAVGAGVLARGEAEGPEAGLFDLVDEIVRQLLTAGRAKPAWRLARLAARTTASLPALKAYLRGEHAFRLARHLEARAAYEEAVALDPGFALAHYRLAGARAASADAGSARAASAEAMRHRDRLSEHDRLLVEAQDAWLSGDADGAERRYAAAVGEQPDDLEAWYLLGDVHFHGNPYRGRSIREAREPLERALALDPAHVGALSKLARLAAVEGRSRDLADRVERFLALSPDADQAIAMRALRAFVVGGAPERAALIRDLGGVRALAVAIAFGDVALYAGSLAELEPIGRAMLALVRSDELRALCRLMLAHVAMARGRPGAALDELDAARADDDAWALAVRGLLVATPFFRFGADVIAGTVRAVEQLDAANAPANVSQPLALHNGLNPHIRAFVLGLLRARSGEVPAIAAAAEELAELEVPPGADALVEHLERVLDALVRRGRGDPGGALAALEGARHEVWYQVAVGSPVFAGAYGRILRGELLAACGRGREALGWLDAIGERSPWELPYVAAARWTAAEVCESLGDEHGAAQRYRRFIETWKECDRELAPIVAEAASRLQRLDRT